MTDNALTTTSQELLLAASLMARPELVPVLYPPTSGDLRLIENPTVRGVISILMTYGSAYASPVTMMAALTDSTQHTCDGDDIIAVMNLIPPADDVTLAGVEALRTTIEQTANRRQLARELGSAQLQLRNPVADADGVVSTVERSLRNYRQNNAGIDTSIVGIIERMKKGEVTRRWKVGLGVPGGQFLDDQLKGIDAHGEFSTGLVGSGEVITVAAGYGLGKSRLLFNWFNSLLDQGAKVGIVAGEDSATSYAVKMMGARFDIEKWMFDYYLADPAKFGAQFGVENCQKVSAALDWYESLGERLHIIDGQGRVNIFKPSQCIPYVEEDIAIRHTDVWAWDYFQALFKGETAQLEQSAQDIRSLGGRTGCAMLVLSQISNETMKFDAAPGQLPTKGTGELGQISHLGFQLKRDIILGQKEITIVQVKGRDAGTNLVYAHFNETTGKITDYTGTSLYGQDPPQEPGSTRKQPAKGGKR